MNITEIQTAALTSYEAAQSLTIAAQAAVEGRAQIDKGKAKGAAALAVMIAGFSDDAAATHEWAFDMKGNDGQVKFHVRCTGTDEFGGTTGEWRAEPKKAQTAYKCAFQSEWFGLSAPVAAVWTMASKAVPMALAIRQEGMAARIEAGELKLDGGNTERAKAMREAKSLSALAKVVEGASGTNRDEPQNEKGGTGEGVPSLAAAYAMVKHHIAALAALTVEGAEPSRDDVPAPTAQQLREILAPIARDVTAVIAAFGDGTD